MDHNQKFLFVGLGNPGKKYQYTRHNIGFLFLDWWKEQEGGSEDFKEHTSIQGYVYTKKMQEYSCIFLKPTTFMNLSGQGVAKAQKYYTISPECICIIYDDVALPLGKVRYRQSGSSGGHNGVKSIIDVLGEKFSRIKIGIGGTYDDLATWILQPLTHEEKRILFEISFPEAKKLIEMHMLNKKL